MVLLKRVICHVVEAVGLAVAVAVAVLAVAAAAALLAAAVVTASGSSFVALSSQCTLGGT